MNITILTPDKQVFKGEIVSVKVPGTMGQFQVLNNHAPIVSSLEAGKVHIVTAAGEHEVYNESTGDIEVENEAGKTITFSIEAGFIEVLKNEIALLVQGVSFS